jgi:hypothetical protein
MNFNRRFFSLQSFLEGPLRLEALSLRLEALRLEANVHGRALAGSFLQILGTAGQKANLAPDRSLSIARLEG